MLIGSVAALRAGACSGTAQLASAPRQSAMQLVRNTGRRNELTRASSGSRVSRAQQCLDILARTQDRPLRFQLQAGERGGPARGLGRIAAQASRGVGTDTGVAASAAAAQLERMKAGRM